MIYNRTFWLAIASTCLFNCSSTSHPNQTYNCTAYEGKPQIIPGRLQNEFYDALAISDAKKLAGAGEGICYHDGDNHNSGSGDLNKGQDYFSRFRKYESPDISYTKLNNHDVAVDDSEFNLVKPEANSLYLGWIAPGEWVNYTVEVRESGYYTISTMYTSKFGGHISFEVNGKDISGPLEIGSTFNAADPVEWRQAHHWNKAEHLGRFYLQRGKQVIRIRFLDQPVMNFDYMDFEKIK